VVSSVETSGTCGPISQQTIEIPQAAGAGCTGVIADATPDNCHTTTGATCPAPSLGAGFTTERTLEVTWAADGNAGSGTHHAIVRDGSGSVYCESTYTVTYDCSAMSRNDINRRQGTGPGGPVAKGTQKIPCCKRHAGGPRNNVNRTRGVCRAV
jgi:hypothetical protein